MVVENRCYKPIKERFKVLLDSKQIIQQQVSDDLGIDKGFISRIFNGVEIPSHTTRLRISSYFGVDSSTIWRMEDLPYIREQLKKEVVENE